MFNIKDSIKPLSDIELYALYDEVVSLLYKEIKDTEAIRLRSLLKHLKEIDDICYYVYSGMLRSEIPIEIFERHRKLLKI